MWIRNVRAAMRMGIGAVAAAALWAGSVPAAASTIDLRPHETGRIFSFGPDPGTGFFAQGVVADDIFLEEIGLLLAGTPDTLAFNVLVTGSRVDGGGALGLAPDLDNILFDSGPNTLTSTDLTNYDWTVGTPVVNGETYFIVIDAYTPPVSSGLGNAAAVNQGIDPVNFYADGEFVFYNPDPGETLAAINTNTWERFSSHDTNMAFRAVFTDHVIPEPASALILGAGAAVLAWRRRRR